MYHPTLNLKEALMEINPEIESIHFDIIQIGTGGNGGYLVQRLSKMLYSFSNNRSFSFTYALVDGDVVEKKNLLRQPFIEEDLHQNKSKILAERYSHAYDIPILYKDSYAESLEDMMNCFVDPLKDDTLWLPVLLGCVDNNATRKIMHEVFNKHKNIIYIDSGIDGIDPEEPEETGYSGQVVCGCKLNHTLLLDPVGLVYDNILTDTDSKLPTQACGETVVNHPQRMQTNELAALIMAGYLNTILGEEKITNHLTNFNALTMTCRPTYMSKSPVGLLSDIKKEA